MFMSRGASKSEQARVKEVEKALATSREILEGTSFYRTAGIRPLSKKTKEVGDFYDKTFGWLYDKHMELTGHYKAMDVHLERLVKTMPKGSLVLDPVCGTGHAVEYLLRKRPDIKIIANDISVTMLASTIEKTREYLGNRILFTKNDARDLPFVDDTFTGIVVINGFYWFDDKAGVASELHRVMKKEGLLYSMEEFPFIVTPTKYSAKFGAGLKAAITPLNIEDNTMNWEVFVRNGFRSLRPPEKVRIDDKHDLYLRTYASVLSSGI